MEGPLNLSKFILGFITNAGLTTLRLINCMNMIMDENQGMISHFSLTSAKKSATSCRLFGGNIYEKKLSKTI